jgi:hypothetical protein
MTFMTPDQFFAWMEEQKCRLCDTKAKWFPYDLGKAYCDEHYPLREEKAFGICASLNDREGSSCEDKSEL